MGRTPTHEPTTCAAAELRATLYELLLALDALADTTAAGSNDVVPRGWRELAISAAARARTAAEAAKSVRASWATASERERAVASAIDEIVALHDAFVKMAVGHKRKLAAATLSRMLGRVKARAIDWM